MTARIKLDPAFKDLKPFEARITETLRRYPSAKFLCGGCNAQVFWTVAEGLDPDEGICPMCGRNWSGYISHPRPSRTLLEQYYGDIEDDAAEIMIALRNAPGG